MQPSSRFGRGAAILTCAAAMAGTAIAAPAASAAPSASSCGSRTITIPEKGDKPLQVPVSRIRVEGGATCKQAVAVIRGSLTKHPLDGWSYGEGNFAVPSGLNAELATNGHKKVKWAVVGS